MLGIGMSELVVVLAISLVVFGPGKLPEVGSAIGKSIGEFKKATNLAADSPKHEPEPKQLPESNPASFSPKNTKGSDIDVSRNPS